MRDWVHRCRGLHCTCQAKHKRAPLLVLTGGPGAGKTAVLEIVSRSLCSHVGVLPEAASIIFGGGFPRGTSDVARRSAQIAIYHVQREMERIIEFEDEAVLILCDRGTVDGIAYWPGDASSYWNTVRTSREEQFARYDGVIHLRTPGPDQGYNHQNPVRSEDAEEAAVIDERILNAWEGHPNRVVIDSTEDFMSKASLALWHIWSALPECCRPKGAVGDRLLAVKGKGPRS